MSLIATFLNASATGVRAKIGRDSAKGTTQDFRLPTDDPPGEARLLFRDVACSYQDANARTILKYQQRNIEVSNDVYFVQDPGVEANDIIRVERCSLPGTVYLRVVGVVEPTGLGSEFVWKVSCERTREPC